MQYEIVRLFRYQEWRKRGQEREAEIKLEIKTERVQGTHTHSPLRHVHSAPPADAQCRCHATLVTESVRGTSPNINTT